MSQNTRWFHDLTTDEAKHERCYWLRIGLSLFVFLALAVILSPLVGCATQPKPEDGTWNRVCYERPLGQTEEGHLVVLHSCVTIEAFKAAQK